MKYLTGDLIERNISKRVFLSICIVGLSVALLDSLFTFLSQLSDLSDSYTVRDIFFYSLNSVPISVYEYLSFISLLGVLVGLGSLKEEGEIMASKALGKSDVLIFIASLRPTLVIILLALVFQETALPSISQKNEETRLIKQNNISYDDGYWYLSESSINFFKSTSDRENIEEVTIYELGDKKNIEKIINAKSANLINGEWILEDLFSRDFVDSEINESKSKIWKESPSDKDMKRLLSPKYLSILELRSVLEEEKLEFKLNSLELEFWRKVFYPITTILLIFLGASFIFGRVRDDTLGKRLLLGVLLAFSLNLVQSLLQSMAVVSFLTPFNAVLLPFLGIFLISLYLWKSRAT